MADLSPSQKLVKYGFINKDYKHFYKYDDKKGYWIVNPEQKGDNAPKDYDGKHAVEERAEEADLTGPGTKDSKGINELTRTGFPKPFKRYKLVYESFGLSLEETYFWILGHIRQDAAAPEVDKITDIFSAAENSSYWGQANYRLGQQQDKITTYLATVGRMVKDLFQIVRELRIHDERLEIYGAWPKTKTADVTLKSLYVEFVERGTESRNSVYFLATQVGYSSLPDLFFNTLVKTQDDIETEVKKWEVNENVKNVLRKKLLSFIVWKEKTEKELKARRQFLIPYLRQHWGAIRMYMSWLKPYLKSTRRLSMSSKQIDSPDIISSFETSVTEIEILAKKGELSGYRPVTIASFKFTTKPMLQFQQDSYQARGAIHVGRVEMCLRAYAWTDEQISAYKKLRQEEDFELLGMMDESVKAAMESLGDTLLKYIDANDLYKTEEKSDDGKKKKMDWNSSMLGPFISVFQGFGDMFSSFGGSLSFGFGDKKKGGGGSNKDAIANAHSMIWNVYKNYKKSHGLLSW